CHALDLATRQLMGKPSLDLGISEADIAQSLVGGGRSLCITACSRKAAGGLEQIGIDPLERTEGLEWILEDRLNRGHERKPAAAVAGGSDVASAQAYAALVRFGQVEDHLCQR